MRHFDIKNRTIKYLISFFTILTLFLAVHSTSFATNKCSFTNKSVLLAIADNINTKLMYLSNAATALGNTYINTYLTLTKLTPAYQKEVMKKSVTSHNIRELFLSSKPHHLTYRASYPSSYILNTNAVTPTMWFQINALQHTLPSLKLLFDIFNDGWVYITTPDGLMSIYPYLPLSQAIHDEDPTKTIYYQAANFKDKRAGWSNPYIDLVGDGMLVTVSYPMYHNSILLGVSSVDITIRQLTQNLFPTTIKRNHYNLLALVTKNGLAISSTSKPSDTKSYYYYRTSNGMKRSGIKNGVASSNGVLNFAVETILAYIHSHPQQSFWKYRMRYGKQYYAIDATPVSATGWFLIGVHKL